MVFDIQPAFVAYASGVIGGVFCLVFLQILILRELRRLRRPPRPALPWFQ